jgi:hypothetical protein
MAQMARRGGRQRGTEPGGAMAGASPRRPISASVALGVMLSGRKRSGGVRLPHLWFDRHREAAAHSRDDEFLQCMPVLGEDGVPVILWPRRRVQKLQRLPAVLLVQTAGHGRWWK